MRKYQLLKRIYRLKRKYLQKPKVLAVNYVDDFFWAMAPNEEEARRIEREEREYLEYLRNYDEDDYYDYYYENEPFLPSNNSDDDEYNSDENYRY